MVVKGEILHVSISAAELRLLRVSIGSVLEHIRLSVDTMDMFDCKDQGPTEPGNAGSWLADNQSRDPVGSW